MTRSVSMGLRNSRFRSTSGSLMVLRNCGYVCPKCGHLFPPLEPSLQPVACPLCGFTARRDELHVEGFNDDEPSLFALAMMWGFSIAVVGLIVFGFVTADQHEIFGL